MSWQRIPLDRSLGAYCADWDALNARYYGGHPFLDSRFVESLLKYFGSGREQLFIHCSQGEIDGLLILRPRRFWIWQLFVPGQLQASPLLVPCTEMLAGLFKALPPTAWTIEFVNQDPGFSPPGLLEEAADRLVLPHALTMNVALDGDFSTYWNGRSQNLVKNIRRYLNRATAELGAADLQVVIEPESMAGGVARFGELESSGWKRKAGTAVSIDNTQGHFYAELMSRFASSGQAQVLEYRLGERLIASRLVIGGGAMSIILKTTYDEAFSRFAPGRLLLHALLERAFNGKRQKVVEFYTNATQDQLAWATGQRVISHVTCFRWPWLAALYQTYRCLKPSGASELGETGKPDSFAVEVFDQIDELPKACKSLFEAGERDSFDLGSGWFGLLVGTAIPEGATARFYVLSQGGRVRCVLPLLTGKHCISALTTFYTSLYRPLIADGVRPDELAVVLRRVMRDTGASSIRLDAMDPLHPSYQNLLAALRQVGLRTFTFFNYGNWCLPVPGRSFDDYFNGLSSQIRNTVKRREKKLLAAGGRLEMVTGGEGLEPAIQAWDRIYRSSWKVPEPYPGFVPGLLRLCAQKGWLRLGFAYYGNVPIAAQIWIVSHGRAAIYKLAYDESYAQHSAGTLLTAHLMRHVLDEDKVGEVDYLIGDDAYKKDWMNQRRERWGIVAYNLASLRGLVGYGVQCMSRLWHWFSKKSAGGSNRGRANNNG
jgi:CelD/BcsL family acetyltransferase involved in cellulose biosynthesis